MIFSGDFLSGLLNTSKKADICNPNTGEAEARGSAVYRPGSAEETYLQTNEQSYCPRQGAPQQVTAAAFSASRGGTHLYSSTQRKAGLSDFEASLVYI